MKLAEIALISCIVGLLLSVGSLLFIAEETKEEVEQIKKELMNLSSEIEAQEFIIINLLEVIDAVEERQEQKSRLF